ncbi:MAG TPA: GDSL-type esterase/lipase family protein, partial [Vicinamibacterales bacterium]|nr:GDSL-type esterase/lipase family protein [Vicinamibacterales bacterium]
VPKVPKVLKVPIVRKLIRVTVPAIVVASIASAALLEAWVRFRWDEKRGTPSFYISDPVLGERLNPGYDGYFAGVPVKINSLGFRDPREYSLEKPRGTFRIVVLGDSVTFGHGALYEATYPYLLEQRLRAWRRDVQWQVWNLGVPGFSTRDELTYLQQIGDRYAPDLVIVGFFINDLVRGGPKPPPGALRRAVSRARQVVQQHLYSYQLYKKSYATLQWRLSANDASRQQMELLAEGEALLNHTQSVEHLPEQRLSDVDYFDDAAVASFACPKWQPLDHDGGLRARLRDGGPDVDDWIAAVRELQQLHQSGKYRVVFFINMAPVICQTEDRFHDGGALADDAALRAVLSAGTPVFSSTAAFLHYRPSQMPVAGGHSIGNSNRVKAEALFEGLRDSVLPSLVPPLLAQ